MSALSDTLTDAFAAETDEKTAAAAAENVTAFAEEYDEDLTAETVTDLLAEAPYDAFARRFNWVVGELAAATDDCTDSREYRIGGFGDLAADAAIGA